MILRVLKPLKKVLTADDDLLSAAYVRSKAWDQQQTSMTTEDLRKAFARKIGMRMLLDAGQLKKTIQNGVQSGTWVYYDAAEQFGYDKDSPPPLWQIGDEAILYLPDEAARLGVRIKGKWKPATEGKGERSDVETCPVCGNPQDQCTCGVAIPGKKQIPARLSGQGAVAQAFQQVIDACHEHELTRVRQMFLRVEGLGKQGASDARALGLAIPQFGKGRFGIDLEMSATFGPGAKSFTLHFKGGWDRFKRLKSVAEQFGQEADEVKVTMRVGMEFDEALEVDGAQLQTMREVLVTLGLGKIVVEVVPAE